MKKAELLARIEQLEAQVAQTHEYIKSMHGTLETFEKNHSGVDTLARRYADQDHRITGLRDSIENLFSGASEHVGDLAKMRSDIDRIKERNERLEVLCGRLEAIEAKLKSTNQATIDISELQAVTKDNLQFLKNKFEAVDSILSSVQKSIRGIDDFLQADSDSITNLARRLTIVEKAIKKVPPCTTPTEPKKPNRKPSKSTRKRTR